MALFEESFADPAKLSHDWIVAPGMAVRKGVLEFSPGPDEGFCVGVTRRTDFRDFSITADVRIVCAAVGLVLRAVGPGQYYMVQFDLANKPSVVWLHTFTPSADGGYRVELVPSALVPQAGVWHRMSVVARGDAFEVLLGEPTALCGTAHPGTIRGTPIGRAPSVSGSMAGRRGSIVAYGWKRWRRSIP